MKITHTTGKWNVQPVKDEYGKNEIWGEDTTCPIAIVQSSDPYMGYVARAEANAKLISAAPELLEVLIQLCKEVQAVKMPNSETNKAWKAGMDVITKATQ